jgi:hypothetical protein
MKTILITITIALLCSAGCLAQGKALTFDEAAQQGIPFQRLDSLYKSAVHDNASLAVFKTPDEQAKLMQAYTKLLQDLGAHLKANNFKWQNQPRGMNRIYLSPDGKIDYFLYHFPAGQVTLEKEWEFARLLNRFIQNYRFAITAPEKFAQCSPVRYSDI